MPLNPNPVITFLLFLTFCSEYRFCLFLVFVQHPLPPLLDNRIHFSPWNPFYVILEVLLTLSIVGTGK